jgi:hypothetical protein
MNFEVYEDWFVVTVGIGVALFCVFLLLWL